jgi:hypothetical protein
MTVAPLDNEANLTDWWQQEKANTPKPLRKALPSTTLLVPWMAWKHRNDFVFHRGTAIGQHPNCKHQRQSQIVG